MTKGSIYMATVTGKTWRRNFSKHICAISIYTYWNWLWNGNIVFMGNPILYESKYPSEWLFKNNNKKICAVSNHKAKKTFLRGLFILLLFVICRIVLPNDDNVDDGWWWWDHIYIHAINISERMRLLDSNKHLARIYQRNRKNDSAKSIELIDIE